MTYPAPCPFISFEDDPYTMGLVLCDDAGLTDLRVLNRLRAMSGASPYEGAPFACTAHAHLAGQHIECLSPAHAVAT